MMCEGASLDEVRFQIHGIIERYGWFIQYVEYWPVTRAWAYTIGLSAGFGHPELVVTGVTPEGAARVLNGIGELIRKGAVFTPGHQLADPSGSEIRLSGVHPRHFERGVFAGWVDYYGCLGPPYPSAEALEVILPGGKAMLESSISVIG